MNIPQNYKKLLPHIIAIGVFILIALAYMAPALEGKAMYAHDVTQARGMQKEINDYHEKTGDYSLWTNSTFGGMPTYMIGNGGAPIYNIFSYLSDFRKLFPTYSADILIMYMLGFYILLIVLGINPWLAIGGAIAFGFSSYNVVIIMAGHVNKAYVIATCPAVIAGVIRTYRGKYLSGGIITCLALGINVMFNHPQMSYYLLLLLLCFGIVRFIYEYKNKTLVNFSKATLTILIVATLSILPSITRLWTSYEYSKETIRGGSELKKGDENKKSGLDTDYALAWSYGVKETFTLLIPNFNGGASVGSLSENSNLYNTLLKNGVPRNQAKQLISRIPTYWGEQSFTAGPVYFGAIIIFLFALGLFLVKGHLKWWLLVGTILSILLSWGENFYFISKLFLDYFPMYNKFRAVSSILVIASITMPMLAFIVFQKILSKELKKDETIKGLKNALYVVGGICLLFFLFSKAFFNFSSPSDQQLINAGYPDWFLTSILEDRARLLKMDALRSLIFILIIATSIWAFIADKIKANTLIIIAIFAILVDMWGVDKRYVNNDDFEAKKKNEEIQPNQANLQILQDNDPNFKVLNLAENPFTEATTSYFHKSLGGYHAAKLSRYQDLIEHHLSKQNRTVLNMLNTKYFIIPDKNNQPQARYNSGALGNAWFVNSYEIVETPNEEIDALNSFNPSTTAIVNKKYLEYLKKVDTTSTDSITANHNLELTEYKPNELTYVANTKTDQLAVFSEIYYNNKKGWNAYIDEVLTPHICVNYILRGLVVPAGEHKIVFKFEPRSFFIGQKISLISSIIIGIGLLVAIGTYIYRVAKKNLNEKMQN